MRTYAFILLSLVTGTASSAGLVYPTVMEIEISGVIGEQGTLKPVPFRLFAEYKDKESVWPVNKQQLKRLEVSVNGVSMSISDELYKKLSGVPLSKVHLSYIQAWSDKSSIEIVIPYGKVQNCVNHEDGSVHSLKPKKVLMFSISGTFKAARISEACEH